MVKHTDLLEKISHVETFVNSAKVIKDHYDEINIDIRSCTQRCIPFYHLLAHASELLMKAFLLRDGVEESKLKNIELRHNLSGLVNECRERGISLTRSFEKYMNELNESHKDHTYRYLNTGDAGGKNCNA